MDHELAQIVREHSQAIDVHAINHVNNAFIRVTFTDVSIEPPTHTEPDGTRIQIYPKDVSERRIPYDVNVSVDLCLTQKLYQIVPSIRDFAGDGNAFYAPCLIVQDPYQFNGWGLAIGRATTGDPKQHIANGQVLRFEPGVWDEFHASECARHNRRSKCPVQVPGYKRQLWSKLGVHDQKTWSAYCETPDAPGMACVKLIVFIGHRDEAMNCFVVTKMGKKSIFETTGDVLATLPPYIEQSKELWIDTTTEYVYSVPFIRLPCMLGSTYCHTTRDGQELRMDSGIVLTGSCDKVVIMQQQLGNNRVFLFNQKSGQVIAEVRSAHIGKRRSTSAFRLILSPKDGAYILLPFLKRASGTDVRVHIVDFMRLLWEYDIFDDPHLKGIDWGFFGLCVDALESAAPKSNRTVHTIVRKVGKPSAFRTLCHLDLEPSCTRLVWRLSATWCGHASQTLKTPTKPSSQKRKSGKPIKKTVRSTPAHASVRKILRLLLKMCGRRTIQSIETATSVLDLSFFGSLDTNCNPRDQFDRYMDIQTFLLDVCKPPDFEQGAGQILTNLAIEGARERTLNAQRSYVLNNVLRSELFPHLGDTASVETRRAKLFYAMNQLFTPLFDLYTKRREFPSDKDSMGNKRLDMFDEIIGIYFRQQSQSNRGTLAKLIQGEANAGVHIDSKLLYGLIANRRFENSIRYPFNTGKTKLSDKRPGSKKAGQNGSGGVQQTSGNVMARMSHVRRVRHAHINAENKAIKPRMVHAKDVRRFCPGESPEGTMCGLLKNLALLVHVSVGTTCTNDLAALVFGLVDPAWVCMADEMPWDVGTTLVINGVIKGFVAPAKLRTMCVYLRQCRRGLNISFDTSIYVGEDGRTLHLDSNAGRMMDPLIVTESVQNGRFFDVCRNWLRSNTGCNNLLDELLRYGCVEYICANEEADCWIATSWADWFTQLKEMRRTRDANGAPSGPMFTHLMIHAVALFDYSIASMIFPECNQGPRNTYQAKMLTQAVSLPDRISATSTEGTKYVLNYGQAPLVESVTGTFDGLRSLTTGINCIVQMKRRAFNMEDALLINQGSIDRGLFHMTYTYNLILETEKHQQIEVPNMRTCRNIKQANYNKLDPKTGVIRVGTNIKENDVLVGLTAKVTNFSHGGKIKIDVSLIYTKKIPARVSRITRTTNRFGNPLINFTVVATNKELPFPAHVLGSTPLESTPGRWTQTRPTGISVPGYGEKFASRSAQKGVIGLIIPEADMDFVCEGPNTGMRADLEMSPDAIPSRMTMGSPIVEMLLGVLGAVLGVQIDGTPFSMRDIDLAEIGDMLESVGQNRFCEEQMCSGITGERIRGEDHLPACFERLHASNSGQRRGCILAPVYYQRLAHFVAAKIHSRNNGPLNPGTRQPTNGRAKKGGLRFGTMEVDAMVGHGAAALLRERMLLASDNYYTPICCLCHLLAETARDGTHMCRNCGVPGTCEMVQMPYAAKIMIHLYQSAHLPWRMAIEP